ncbi:uncharacterized protein TNCT_150801 [Trichonephila clavata]|uniref:Uncharacterized protein n=1 Tax=Trichonephila clavata TaxID=2740835 RepID=A0A8X6I142_TRICU|nr:uncharacterized protein TNCT_150801 [Trichonephila clavata]
MQLHHLGRSPRLVFLILTAWRSTGSSTRQRRSKPGWGSASSSIRCRMRNEVWFASFLQPQSDRSLVGDIDNCQNGFPIPAIAYDMFMTSTKETNWSVVSCSPQISFSWLRSGSPRGGQKNDVFHCCDKICKGTPLQSCFDLQTPWFSLANNPLIKKQDFIVCTMTEPQLELLELYGKNIIMMDSTHGTHQYGYLLTTIMVSDDNHEGLPIAVSYSNIVSSDDLEPYLKK